MAKLAELKGSCKVAQPDKNLYKFDAYFESDEQQYNLDDR